jgi:hypothetical protein
MMILYSSGIGGWALQRLASLDTVSGDLRWAVITLVSRSMTAAIGSLLRNIGGRAWQGARFAGAIATADTMVAAGGG